MFFLVPGSQQPAGGCFTNVSRALQNNIAKIYNASNHIYGNNFRLKRVSQAWFWAHAQICNLKFSYTFCNTYISREYFGELVIVNHHPDLIVINRVDPGLRINSPKRACTFSPKQNDAILRRNFQMNFLV